MSRRVRLSRGDMMTETELACSTRCELMHETVMEGACEHSMQGRDLNLAQAHDNSLGPMDSDLHIGHSLGEQCDVVPAAQDAPHPVPAFRIAPSKITQRAGEADLELLIRSPARYSVALEREPIKPDGLACISCGDAGCGCRLAQMCQWSTGQLPYDLAAAGTQTPSKADQDFDLVEVLGNASGFAQSCEAGEICSVAAAGTQTPSKEDQDLDLAEVLGNASGSVQSCEAGDICSICLESTSRTPMLLACGHEFCHPCLARHVELSLRDGLVPWCPLCRCRLLSVEASFLCQRAVDVPDPAHDILETQAAPQSSWKRFRQQRAFKRTARKLHLKLCPGCGAMIQKADGCNHMKCRCGRDFSWDEAEAVVPCSKVHWNGWRVGKTCKNCTCSAHMKLAALRAGAALGAAPVAAVGAVAAVSGAAIVVAGAAVVTAVPAVVCTPLAIAYEPVRRLRRKKTNVFAKGICAGGSAVAIGAFLGALVLFGNDSD